MQNYFFIIFKHVQMYMYFICICIGVFLFNELRALDAAPSIITHSNRSRFSTAGDSLAL